MALLAPPQVSAVLNPLTDAQLMGHFQNFLVSFIGLHWMFQAVVINKLDSKITVGLCRGRIQLQFLLFLTETLECKLQVWVVVVFSCFVHEHVNH